MILEHQRSYLHILSRKTQVAARAGIILSEASSRTPINNIFPKA